MRVHIVALIVALLPLTAVAHAQSPPDAISGVVLALHRSPDAGVDLCPFACGAWLGRNTRHREQACRV